MGAFPVCLLFLPSVILLTLLPVGLTVFRLIEGVADSGHPVVVLVLVAGGHGELVDVVVSWVEVVGAWVGETEIFA